jgi:RNA polymerase sigma factor (sigma-70 family)
MTENSAPSGENPFIGYITRLRAGDASALEELVARYEPVIRLEARMRLRAPHLRAVLDSMDICQSVLKSFFTRAAAGQFSIDRPEDLNRLLVQMACNKSKEAARKEQAQKRDGRRTARLGEDTDGLAGAADPFEDLEWKELLVRGRELLDPEERLVADRRVAGESWDEIAAALGGTPDRHRMQLKRAQDRIVAALGLGAEA